ncbi:MAG: lamin tail domain-containing protein, partial [Chloroflexi bacterium]|nr:lamin tail domain-containing protein [Chloroflexota bacterium]
AVDQAGNRRTNLADTISVTNRGPASLLPVVINEWMADNAGPGGLADPADGLFQDWFELFNPNTTAVDLSGYFLTDDLANPTKFSIPPNTVIAGRGFLLAWADENGSQNSPASAGLHANFKLSSSGEALGLFAPDGFSPQHTVVFGPQFENVSQGLFPDGAMGSIDFMTNWTPRAPNRLDLPASPEITACAVEAGRVTLTVRAIPGRSYRLEYKDDLGAPAWIPLGTGRTAASAILTLTGPIGPEPQRFLRVRLE